MNTTNVNSEKMIEGGELKHKDFVLMKSCPYHPITFSSDCLACDQRCVLLQGIIPESFEKLISKQLRDELYEYLYGKNNPIIKLRELTGIPLRVDIRRDDPNMSPSKIAYLQDLKEEDYRKHWRLFFKGYYAWRAMGEMQQGGFFIEQLPDDMKELVSYYQAHHSIMRGVVKPEDVLVMFDTNKMDDSAITDIEFSSKKEAAIKFIEKAKDLLDGEKDNELISEIVEIVSKLKKEEQTT